MNVECLFLCINNVASKYIVLKVRLTEEMHIKTMLFCIFLGNKNTQLVGM